MPRKLPAAVDARIGELFNGGRTAERQIVTVLGREGVKVTAAGVHYALARLGLATPRKATGKAKASQRATSRDGAPAVTPPSAPSVGASDPDDLPAQLRRTIAALTNAATQAETDKDVARIVACSRAITQATALQAKLTPAPPADVNERPDMVLAAKRAREAVHALFDRLLGAAP